MADRFTFFRLMAKEIARRHGYFASFMPKLSSELTGSGAHYNMFLADKDTKKTYSSIWTIHGVVNSQS